MPAELCPVADTNAPPKMSMLMVPPVPIPPAEPFTAPCCVATRPPPPPMLWAKIAGALAPAASVTLFGWTSIVIGPPLPTWLPPCWNGTSCVVQPMSPASPPPPPMLCARIALAPAPWVSIVPACSTATPVVVSAEPSIVSAPKKFVLLVICPPSVTPPPPPIDCARMPNAFAPLVRIVPAAFATVTEPALPLFVLPAVPPPKVRPMS